MDRKAIRRLLLSASREQSHWLVRLYEGTISPALMLVYWTLVLHDRDQLEPSPSFSAIWIRWASDSAFIFCIT